MSTYVSDLSREREVRRNKDRDRDRGKRGRHADLCILSSLHTSPFLTRRYIKKNNIKEHTKSAPRFNFQGSTWRRSWWYEGTRKRRARETKRATRKWLKGSRWKSKARGAWGLPGQSAESETGEMRSTESRGLYVARFDAPPPPPDEHVHSEGFGIVFVARQ